MWPPSGLWGWFGGGWGGGWDWGLVSCLGMPPQALHAERPPTTRSSGPGVGHLRGVSSCTRPKQPILVVTVRVPVWWGQNADLRLRSILPFLFLKRPSTSHTRGLNPPPMSRRRWESTYVYLAGCSSPLEVQWYLVHPTVPLRPPSPKPLPIGTTCFRKYHWERFFGSASAVLAAWGPVWWGVWQQR